MNEENSTPTHESTPQKMKIKEALSTQELKTLLSGWLTALEEEKDFAFEIKGHSGYVPKKVLSNNTTMGEFEFKDGEYEFELELKWKDDSAKDSQKLS